MTKAEVLAMLETIEDISIDKHDNIIDVTIEDFEGFEEDGEEVFRTTDISVEIMIDWLESHCISQKGRYYTTYCFDDFEVCVGYSSMDI